VDDYLCGFRVPRLRKADIIKELKTLKRLIYCYMS
jgi:hypothetical protein